jgi:hypothetical protein
MSNPSNFDKLLDFKYTKFAIQAVGVINLLGIKTFRTALSWWTQLKESPDNPGDFFFNRLIDHFQPIFEN